jgi:hypothetical protein
MTGTTEYAYLTGSPLVEQITFRENGNLRMITRKAYDGLNRLTSIVSSNASAVVLSSNAYHYNLASPGEMGCLEVVAPRREAVSSRPNFEDASGMSHRASQRTILTNADPKAGRA